MTSIVSKDETLVRYQLSSWSDSIPRVLDDTTDSGTRQPDPAYWNTREVTMLQYWTDPTQDCRRRQRLVDILNEAIAVIDGLSPYIGDREDDLDGERLRNTCNGNRHDENQDDETPTSSPA